MIFFKKRIIYKTWFKLLVAILGTMVIFLTMVIFSRTVIQVLYSKKVAPIKKDESKLEQVQIQQFNPDGLSSEDQFLEPIPDVKGVQENLKDLINSSSNSGVLTKSSEPTVSSAPNSSQTSVSSVSSMIEPTNEELLFNRGVWDDQIGAYENR